jgi:TRAP-type uncharacterized transport system substrate-binding protein
VAAILLTAGLWWYGHRPRSFNLRMTAGDELSHRHDVALQLASIAADHELTLRLTPTAGSNDALQRLIAGEFDVAYVQGGLDVQDQSLRLVAVFPIEPLQAFVRPELLPGGLPSLRGKRINVGAPGSGTRQLTLQTLAFAGLLPGRDFEAWELSNTALSRASSDSLPDAVFAVSPLPWKVGDTLVREHGFRMLPLPFADAMALQYAGIESTSIPAYSYRVLEPEPAAAVTTVGVASLLVARTDVPPDAITRLLECVFDTDFPRVSNLPELDSAAAARNREYPLHSGADVFLRRNQPLITGEVIESVENLRSFLVSAAIAAILLYRWRSKRQLVGFEKYLDQVTEVEVAALDLERRGVLSMNDLRSLRQQLTDIKSDALEKHSSGELRDDEQMGSLLLHIGDVRRCLESLYADVSRRAAAAAAGSHNPSDAPPPEPPGPTHPTP